MSGTSAGAPLRIVHVVPTYLPATRYGGPIYSVHGLCKSLAALGHDVQVLTTNVDGPGVSPVPIGTPVELDGVRVTYFSCPSLRRLYWAPAMRSVLRRELRSADVLHLHSVFLWPTSAAARIATKLHVPYLLAPRGALVPELIRKKSALAKLAWLGLIERRTVAAAARIHVTTQAEADDVARIFSRMPAACVVPNGVDIPEDVAGARPSSALRAEIDAGPYAIFLGRINWKKGLDRALWALATTEIRLLIAGNDEDNHRAQLEPLIRELGLESQVRFVGAVAGDDKWALLANARFLVLPSYNENFGNVVIEAFAAACPALVTPEVGAAHVITEAGAGLVAAGDAPTLRAAMLRLWNEPETRERMGEAGARYVRERLTWKPIAQAMERCYREVVAERR